MKEKGTRFPVGIDEAGRGSLAGPVVAACCWMQNPEHTIGVQDSKVLSPKRRRAIFDRMMEDANFVVRYDVVSHEVIDEINILQASLLAMLGAVSKLPFTPDMLLVDGNRAPKTTIPTWPIVEGDKYVASIAAASIVAKVVRDMIMTEYGEKYPYGFETHFGYGTPGHLKRLHELGPSEIHRKTYAPVRASLARIA